MFSYDINSPINIFHQPTTRSQWDSPISDTSELKFKKLQLPPQNGIISPPRYPPSAFTQLSSPDAWKPMSNQASFQHQPAMLASSPRGAIREAHGPVDGPGLAASHPSAYHSLSGHSQSQSHSHSERASQSHNASLAPEIAISFASASSLMGSPTRPSKLQVVNESAGMSSSSHSNQSQHSSQQPASLSAPTSPTLSLGQPVTIEAELTKQNLYKTELCRNWRETGLCRYGNKCQVRCVSGF
jgi:hypothetical protein